MFLVEGMFLARGTKIISKDMGASRRIVPSKRIIPRGTFLAGGISPVNPFSQKYTR